jgi:hypothetical protein
MVDNVSITQGAGTAIAADEVTDGVLGTVKVQMFKLMDGTLDSTNKAIVSAAGALKVDAGVPVNTTTLGTLTASDAVVAAPIGDGSLISGTSTAGSVVFAVVPDGFHAWTLMIKGYVSGAIYTEASNNSTNGTDGDWVEIKGRRTGTAVGVESVVYTMVANGYYRGNAAGFKYLRARLIGGTGPTIQFVLSRAMGATFLNSGVPGGNSAIGSVKIIDPTSSIFASLKPASTAAVATDTSIVTTPHPSGVQFVQGYQPATTTGSITTATSVVGPINVNGLNIVTVGVYGTYTGVTFIFEASTDSTNWFSIQGSRVDNGLVSTGLVLGSTANYAWDIPIGAWTTFRVRATAYGTGTASILLSGQSMPYEPAPSAITQGVIQPGTALPTSPTVAPVIIGGGSIGGGTNATTATVKAASTVAVATDTALVVSIHPSSSSNPPAITKGTQGAIGVTTQDLKDAGRNVTNYFMNLPVSTSATDTLMSLTGYKSGAAVGATTTPAVVTTGKTYRITSVTLNYVASAAAGTAKFTLRALSGGVVLIGSPPVQVWVIGGPAAVAGVSQTVHLELYDGLEFAAGFGIGVSMVGLNSTSAAAITGFAQIAINGYEY